MHSAVEGGAGAYLSSLRRIKWRNKRLDCVLLGNGISFTLGADGDPKMAMRLARRDLEAVTLAESGLAGTLSSVTVPDGYHRASSSVSGFVPIGLLPGQVEAAQQRWWNEFVHIDGQLVPWLKPAIDALKAARSRSVAEAVSASFASLIEGGWWPQSRLCFAKLAQDPFCQVCGAEHGTVWHRVLCSFNRRGDSSERKIFDIGKERWWDPLFSRGIPALPLSRPQPRAQTWTFPENAEAHLVTGEVFTDGALRGLHPEARRAGWAFALVDSSSLCLKMAVFGVCAEQWLTVLRAELRAIEEAIRRAVAPLVVHTDSAAAVAAYNKGQKYCCSARADGADIWRRIWLLLADFGEFRLLKVKAHTTISDVAEGLISAEHQAGNAAADHFAVQARKAAEAASPLGSFEAHYARARVWYKSIFMAIADWKEDVFADLAHVADAHEQEARDRHSVAQRRRHEIWTWRQAWLCRTCGKTFHSDSHPRHLEKAECRGSTRARLLHSMGVQVPPEAWDCHAAQELARQGEARWVEGDEGHQPLAEARLPHTTAVRRRLVGKQPDPRSMTVSCAAMVAKEAVKENESGHILVKAGSFTFCDRCGRWAIDRLGPGLIRKCRGSVDTSLGAYRVRRDRLRAGRHPLTNQPLG